MHYFNHELCMHLTCFLFIESESSTSIQKKIRRKHRKEKPSLVLIVVLERSRKHQMMNQALAPMSSQMCKRINIEKTQRSYHFDNVVCRRKIRSIRNSKCNWKSDNKKRSSWTPKHVEVCNASEDASDLTISSKKCLKKQTSN